MRTLDDVRAVTHASSHAGAPKAGTRLAVPHVVPWKRRRLELVLSSLMAAAVASKPRVSHADDGPVSESPQRSSAWTAARTKALDEERPPQLETSSSTSSAYALELGSAYLATPFLAVGFTGLLLAADSDLGIG